MKGNIEFRGSGNMFLLNVLITAAIKSNFVIQLNIFNGN